jgi:hypothetical protein
MGRFEGCCCAGLRTRNVGLRWDSESYPSALSSATSLTQSVGFVADFRNLDNGTYSARDKVRAGLFFTTKPHKD